ncbi:MAG TPA: hypothetical protein V6D17_24165 [Candidatus Obscuribacterales bacterium]
MPDASTICAQKGVEQYKRCHFSDAQSLFREAVRHARDENAPPDRLVDLLNNLAAAYLANAKYADAEGVLRETFSLSEKIPDQRVRRLALAKCHTTRANLMRYYDELARAQADLQAAIDNLEDEADTVYSIELLFNQTAILLARVLIDECRALFDQLSQRIRHAVAKGLLSCKRTYRDPSHDGWPLFGQEWDETSTADVEKEYEARLAYVGAALCDSMAEALELSQRAERLCLENGGKPEWLLSEALLQMSNFNPEDRVKAAELASRALEIAEKIYAPPNPMLSIFLFQRAGSIMLIKDRQAGEPLFERALKIIESSFGERHPRSAAAKIRRAHLLSLDGSTPAILKQRELLIEEAIDILDDIFDGSHSDVIGAQLCLASLFQCSGKLAEAEYIMISALAKVEAAEDKQRLMLVVLDSLITFYLQLNRIEQALQYLDKQKSILLTTYTGSAPSCAARLCELAQHYTSIFRDGDAEELLTRARDITKNITESYEASTIQLMKIYADSGRAELAKELLATLPPTTDRSPPSLMRMFKIANALFSADSEQAEKIGLEIFNVSLATLPQSMQALGPGAGLLVDKYLQHNQLEEAHRIVNALTERKEEIGILGRSALPHFLKALADAYAKKRDVRAQKLYEEALASAEECEGLQLDIMEQILASYADFCTMNQLTQKGDALLRRLAEMRRNRYGERSLEHTKTLLGLALTRAEIGDYSEADRLSARALSILDALESSAEEMMAALEVRAAILKALNRHNEACEIDERIKKLRS